MTEITQFLERSGYNQIQTPLILNHTHSMPFMTVETQQKQVKLQGLNGEMLALRGDSTIALILCGVVKNIDPSSTHRIYYDEPNFYQDFDKRVIAEVRQVGVEIISNQNETDFVEVLGLAIAIAQKVCGPQILVEISHATLLKQVINRIADDDAKKYEALLYYLNRKNTREALKQLNDSSSFDTVKIMIEELLTTPKSLDECIYRLASLNTIASIELIESFQPILNWLTNIQSEIKGMLSEDFGTVSMHFDPALIIDKPYYTGETFKIYDTKRHVNIITGGTYRFDTYDVNGCGFSIKYD